jgi:hypothetical protein
MVWILIFIPQILNFLSRVWFYDWLLTLLELAIWKSKTMEQTYGNIYLLTPNKKMECHIDSPSMVDSESIILSRWLSKMHSKVASIWRSWTLSRGWGWLGGMHFCTAYCSNILRHPPPSRPSILGHSSIALSWQLCTFVRVLRRLGLVHFTDLQAIFISSSVTLIDKGAFDSCTLLTRLWNIGGCVATTSNGKD